MTITGAFILGLLFGLLVAYEAYHWGKMIAYRGMLKMLQEHRNQYLRNS